ncbi:hypothetical protein CRYUN_Cryun36dG0011300 [Craigia yunnanensis]
MQTLCSCEEGIEIGKMMDKRSTSSVDHSSFTSLASKRQKADLSISTKVLSAPYLQTTPANNMQDVEHYSLRSQGLCLVPISCTAGVARSNGADLWAPIKATSPKIDKAI